MIWDATGQLNLWFQSQLGDPRWLLPITHVGDRIYLLLIAPLVYFLLSRRDGLFLLFSTAGVFYANSLLKLVFHQPRPFWVSQMGIYAIEGSFGLPSGHAMNTLVIWSLFAILLVRHRFLKPSLAYPFAALIIFFVGASRIVLGAHFLQDTLFGWFVGSLLVAIVLWLEEPIERRLSEVPIGRRIFGLLVLSALLYGMALLAVPKAIPELSQWTETARLSVETTPFGRQAFHDLNPTGMKSFQMVVGLLLGSAFVLWMPFRYRQPSSFLQRCIVGAAALLFTGSLYLWMNVLFPHGGPVGAILQVLLYVLLTVVSFSLVPAFVQRATDERENFF